MENGFSIVVCCYNSQKKIGSTLEYIRRLKKPADTKLELLLIDNNSVDKTLDILANFGTSNSSDTKVFSEPRVGKVFALEKGFSASRYKYIVVCDDDNWLNEDYLKVAFEILERDPTIGVIGGRGVVKHDMQLPGWFTPLQNAWAVGKQAEQSGEVIVGQPAVWGAGMVLRKSAWNEILQSGFNGFLTGRKFDNLSMAGEDTEVCILIKKLGYKIYYEDSLLYTHDISADRLTWSNFKRLWEGFSRSSVYFDMYNYYFTSNNPLNQSNIKRKFIEEAKSNLLMFFDAVSPVNFLKIIFITFIQDRPGYLPGLEKRKFLYRLKELWRIRNTYEDYFKIISNIRM